MRENRENRKIYKSENSTVDSQIWSIFFNFLKSPDNFELFSHPWTDELKKKARLVHKKTVYFHAK